MLLGGKDLLYRKSENDIHLNSKAPEISNLLGS
jgi:hypothetical protein